MAAFLRAQLAEVKMEIKAKSLSLAELYLFGKDVAHADHNTGLVSDVKEPVSQIALAPLPVAMATATEEEGEDEDVESEEPDIICPAGRHQWNHDHCMVCTVCGECTGYGASCIASGRPDRNPGLPCGCGAGDSGCMECGCCRACARENDQDVDVAAAWGQLVAGGLVDNKQADIIVFDVRCEDRLRRRIEEYRVRQRRKQMLQSVKAMKSGLAGLNKLRGDVAEKSSPPIIAIKKRETTKLTSLPPARILLPTELPVIQIACGLHHNVLLIQNGDVYTFGNNQHGQLGLGHFLIRGTPTLIKFSSCFSSTSIIQVAAGSCHTVFAQFPRPSFYIWNMLVMLIYSCAANIHNCGVDIPVMQLTKGQLRRSPPNSSTEENRKDRKRGHDKDNTWNAIPGLINNIGTKFGRRATWIGASGDQTFVKIDESLINSHSLNKSSVVCSKSCIGIIPNQLEQASSFKSLVISKKQMAPVLEVCLDSTYNILWSFSPTMQKITLYNIIITELQNFNCPSSKGSVNSATNKEQDPNLPRILNPEHMLPFKPGISISRAHAALNIMSSLDTLTSAQEQNLQVLNLIVMVEVGVIQDIQLKLFDLWLILMYYLEDLVFVWGRGEYTAKLKVFDIGPEGGDQEIDGDVIVETDEIPYECGARHKYPMLFDEPIQLTANRWYVAWARISGPSSDCGSSGQSVVTTEDQIIFYFKSSKNQIMVQMLMQVRYLNFFIDSQGLSKPCSEIEPVTVLTKDFSRTVTPDCFQSLLKLLRWAWQSFKAGYCETILGSAMPAVAALIDLERLEYICTSCLHLLKIYINEIYPNGPITRKTSTEIPKLAECVADVRALLQHILSDRLPSAQVKASFHLYLHHYPPLHF
ncbi:hypothetical protein CEXT_121812 [Caerostris extrusa]|uniref:PHR domain-containing protein n=1 Tax=Caerostris extrusa TaxID=172846 RepID=A0AAV4VH12_CAEEX|nr:hypothetical protein CEXT_121812 [Caerostris extrusa]